MDGQNRAPVLGEKQAPSFFYTAIYYCAKVIIINLELHLVSEIGERKEHEIFLTEISLLSTVSLEGGVVFIQTPTAVPECAHLCAKPRAERTHSHLHTHTGSVLPNLSLPPYPPTSEHLQSDISFP